MISFCVDKLKATVVNRERHIAKLMKEQLVSGQQQDQQSDRAEVAVQFNYLIPSMGKRDLLL